MKSIKKNLYSLLIFISISLGLYGQTDSAIIAKLIDYSLDKNTLQIKARLFIPETYDEQLSYPVVLSLHGSGGVGTDNYSHLPGISHWCNNDFQAEHPCFFFAPQTPGTWEQNYIYESVMYLLDSLINNFSIDTSRIYITGVSMGGFGLWYYLNLDPDLYAAALPICGSYPGSHAEVSEFVKRIRHIPVWNFHGNLDAAVDVFMSRKIIENYPAFMDYPLYTHNKYRKAYSLNDNEIKDYIVKHSELIYSEVPDWGHNVWDLVDTNLLVKPWLFQQRKHSPNNIMVNRQDLKIKVSGTKEFTFTVSDLTDSVSIWSGKINSANWNYLDKINAASGSYILNSEQLADHPYCLLKFIAHDSVGNAIGKDYSDTLCIDNEVNGAPYIELINDYFLKESSIYSDTYTMTLLLADPESDPLHLSFSVSYDNGLFYTTFAEHETEEGIVEKDIPLNQLNYSDKTVIRVDVSDGENISSVSTLDFMNGNGTGISTEEFSEERYNIFPNPFSVFLNINTQVSGKHYIEVSSLDGQLIYSTWFNGITYQLDLSFLNKGFYFITIRSNDSIRTRKIIKQ